jgi:hypothetical protein
LVARLSSASPPAVYEENADAPGRFPDVPDGVIVSAAFSQAGRIAINGNGDPTTL